MYVYNHISICTYAHTYACACLGLGLILILILILTLILRLVLVLIFILSLGKYFSPTMRKVFCKRFIYSWIPHFSNIWKSEKIELPYQTDWSLDWAFCLSRNQCFWIDQTFIERSVCNNYHNNDDFNFTFYIKHQQIFSLPRSYKCLM